MWMIPEFVELKPHCLHLAYDVCMHGGDRDKHQMLWTSLPELQALAVTCDRSHPHRPWGQTASGSFVTASETEYPHVFCSRFAAAAALAAGSLRILPSASDVTTKVSKALILVEEYHYQVTIPLPSSRLPPVDDKNCLLTAVGPAPPGSRVLRVNFDGGILFPKRPRPGFDFLSEVAQSTSGKVVSITCGVYRTPMQFARQAINLQHPFDMCRALPDPALEVLARTLIDGPVLVAKSRLKTILMWKQWKRELEVQEAALHEAMHPDVARVMEGKNLLLLQKIADSLEWPDANLHHDLVQGFRLIGDEQASGIFPVEPKPALASIEEFWERALLVKHALWQKVADSPADRFSQGLYEVTQNEREKGWLSNPKTWQELENTFGPKWVPVRRFAVEQRDKLRPIDDLAENGVNSAFAACDKLTLRALDELVWSAAFLMRSVMQRGEVRVKLSSGEEIVGPLNDFWKADPERSRPLLKTVDLKAAYKQLAVHPDRQAACVVTIKDPCSSEVRGYISRVLPFGAGASVTAFNRVARLIQRILQEARAINFNYFDDYTRELSALSGSCDKVVHSVLSLLGFGCALEKEQDFAPSADLLGVMVDLSDPSLSKVCVGNKADRCAEVSAAVDEVIRRGSLKAREVASLFGRIQFMEGQIMAGLAVLRSWNSGPCVIPVVI